MGGTTVPKTDAPMVAAQPPSFLASIDWGTKLASTDVKVYFADAGDVVGTKTSAGWNAYEQQQAMLAFQQFSNITGLQFSVTENAGQADLQLLTKQSAGYLGVFNPPGTRNEGVGVFNRTGQGWDKDMPGTGGLEQGGYGFVTLIHEFGHGMGLAHPHDSGGSSTIWQGVSSAFDDLGKFDLNQGIFSTMSYNDGWRTNPDGQNTADPYGWQGTLMAFDIAVLQQKYGTNTTFAQGDTAYSLAIANESGTFWSCIWDAGGTDVISYDGTRRATIDLRAATLDYSEGSGGFVSHAKGIFGGFTIAHGVVVENASGGSGRDVIRGNAADNNLQGGGGGDILTGGAGADVFDYVARSDSGVTRSTVDRITDFAAGDVIDLSLIDAMVRHTVNDAFDWIGRQQFHAMPGELRWKAVASGVMVMADINGDGQADFKLVLEGTGILTHADFVL